MARRKKINIGDVFSFEITDEIVEILKIQPKEVHEKIQQVYDSLKIKRGYCIVINLKNQCALVKLKKLDIENPTLDQIINAQTINITWVFEKALSAKEYTKVGSISMEPIEIKRFWNLSAKELAAFKEGKEVEIEIVEVEGWQVPKTVEKTYDINIIRELFRYKGTDTDVTLMMGYLLCYNRNENNINTLKR